MASGGIGARGTSREGRTRKPRATAKAAETAQSLRAIRLARTVTQQQLADALGVGQDSVSRLEQRRDLRVSTLRAYLEALGGRLTLLAEFPEQQPVIIGLEREN